MKNEKRYWLDVIFTEKKDGHCISESWKGNNLKSILKHLAESLDLFYHNGVVEEPNYETIKRNLENYVDEDFIKREYSTLKKNYKLYKVISEKYKSGCPVGQFKVDNNTKISISSFV